MRTLPERLRDKANVARELQAENHATLLTEAVNEIEKLRYELANTKGWVAYAIDRELELKQEIKRLQAALGEIATRKKPHLAKYSADIAQAALEGRNFFMSDEDIPVEDHYGR